MCKLWSMSTATPVETLKPLTPTELARRAQISVPYASQILSRARPPSARLARVIEDVGGPRACETRPDIFGACAEPDHAPDGNA